MRFWLKSPTGLVIILFGLAVILYPVFAALDPVAAALIAFAVGVGVSAGRRRLALRVLKPEHRFDA